MSQEVRAYLDEDIYDDVCEEHERTGKSKSQIINESVRTGLSDSESNWFMRSFSQALFVVGFVVGYYQSFAIGVMVGLMGLSLMFWVEMQDHLNSGVSSYWTAFKRTIGV